MIYLKMAESQNKYNLDVLLNSRLKLVANKKIETWLTE